MRRAQERACVWPLMLLVFSTCAFALDPSLDISQFAHTAWRVRDGFAKGPIHSIAQTSDGYLWLGTEFGLLRFDGVRAVPWQPPAGEQLPGKAVMKLLVSRDGTLWIGAGKGLASWKNGKLTLYPDMAGWIVDALIEDHEGTVWAGGFGIAEHGRFCAINDARVRCADPGGVLNLYEDSKKTLWVSTWKGLWRWKPQAPEFFSTGKTITSALAEDEDGGLLFGRVNGIQRFVNGKTEAYPAETLARQFGVNSLLWDHDGNLWIGTFEGLAHLHRGRTDVYGYVDGLSANSVHSVFEDREGNIWVATDGGLDRFRNFAVPTFSSKEGLPAGFYGPILAAKDGSLWFGSSDRLTKWNTSEIAAHDRHGRANDVGIMTAVRKIRDSGFRGQVRGLFQDRRGRLWVTMLGGFGYLNNDKFVLMKAVPGGTRGSIAEGARGDLWFSFDDALFHLMDGNRVERIPWDGLGIKDAGGRITVDPLQGGLWIEFFPQVGIAFLRHGHIERSYTTADGLGEGKISHLRSDRDGALWASTESGLSLIKDGHVVTLSSKNGLPCDAVHWSEEDADHSVWLYLECGLVRLAASEMSAWIADPNRTVRLTLLDSSDGVAAKSVIFGDPSSPVSKSLDGKLWFSVENGLSVVDPRRLPFNTLPPPVHIERIVADGKTYWQNWAGDTSSAHPRLPPRARDLTIDFTALSLVEPEKVHFRFKLDGQDKEWREVVNDRRVEYSNLPPRKYRFRVMASNNSGVWNEEGASLDFSIAPAWYQTIFFRALCICLSLLLLWALYQLRVQQLRGEERKLRDAIETIPAMAWIAAPDGVVQFRNRRWVEYTGLSQLGKAEEAGTIAIHPEDLDRIVRRMRASFASGEPFEEEMRIRRTDGEYRWFLNRAVPLRNKRGKVVKWYGAATDIQDRKRAEQLQADLAHVNRVTTLGELAASISHELKQPIAAAMTNANTGLRWLRRDKPDVEEASEAMERIVKDNARAAEIIDRLRSLYKKSPPQRESLDVNEVVLDMVVLLRSEANRYGVSIRTDLRAGLSKILADRVQMQQVLMNIMLNGIEAMKGTGGVLTVESQAAKSEQVMISVIDTGVGLPEEKIDRIFDAFFTTKPQGSGMGLAISRSIIEGHGGHLWATANDGRGAAFHFSLPIAAEMKVPAAGS